MTDAVREQGCRKCAEVTSGDCGAHGPRLYPLAPFRETVDTVQEIRARWKRITDQSIGEAQVAIEAIERLLGEIERVEAETWELAADYVRGPEDKETLNAMFNVLAQQARARGDQDGQ